MSGQTDPWPEYCRRLNKHYRQGNLRVLAGAGLSVDAGFPSWGQLNQALLRKYIEEDLSRDPKSRPIIQQHLDELVSELYETIGREAAADFVWNSSTRENFFEDLRQHLYEGRQLRDLSLTQVHWQLAAMNKAALFTTNFDPLLEIARYRAGGGTGEEPDLETFRSANPPTHGTDPDTSKVYHVHGWIDPDGMCGGSFVLTESQYFELFSRQGQRPNQMLDYALTAGGAVLILGMSLADVNLRRHLYLRSLNRISDSTEIYAVLRVHSRKLLDTYQTLHWANRGVRIIYVEDYDGIPKMLREVKFGLPANATDLLPWMAETFRWVQERLPTGLIFTDQWQTKASEILKRVVSGFRESFAIPQQESINLTLMGQIALDKITIFADTRHQNTGAESADAATRFQLHVGQSAQGIAGNAFSKGRAIEVLDNPEVADENFTPEMKKYYTTRLRSWRSLLAVPHLETSDRLPVLVISVTSNVAQPFWTRFGEKRAEYRDEMNQALELTVQEILTISQHKSAGSP